MAGMLPMCHGRSVAACHGLTVLHDDNDFVTAGRHLTDVSERRVSDIPLAVG